jgi:hypothetical protein
MVRLALEGLRVPLSVLGDKSGIGQIEPFFGHRLEVVPVGVCGWQVSVGGNDDGGVLLAHLISPSGWNAVFRWWTS